MLTRKASRRVLLCGGCLAGALAAVGCTSIPTSAITLSDQLYDYQERHVEHLEQLTAAYDRVLEAEGERQLEPLVTLERRAARGVTTLKGMLAVEAQPSAPVPAEWATDARVTGFRDALASVEQTLDRWRPWYDLAVTYEQWMLALDGDSSFTQATLDDTTSLQRRMTDRLLAPAAGGEDWPTGVSRSQLQSEWSNYDSGLERTDAGARRVGAAVQSVIANIRTRSPVPTLEGARSGLRLGLLEALGESQQLVADLREELREQRTRLGQIRSSTRRDVKLLQENAAEIARGLDALSVGLRRGREAFFGPKNATIDGLKSLAENLGELGVLDEKDVARFAGRLDDVSEKIDKLYAEAETPRA